ATHFARRAIEAGRDRGDPRFLGQAQAALAPWWNAARPPREVLVLRATIRQSLHDFPSALADLDRVIETSPADAQARLTRASVLTVLGRYDAALRDAYLRGAYADCLIDHGRPREAAALVARDVSNDALLLRLALAEAKFADANADEQGLLREHRAELAERFAAARARGDVVHRREEARFALHLERDAR